MSVQECARVHKHTSVSVACVCVYIQAAVWFYVWVTVSVVCVNIYKHFPAWFCDIVILWLSMAACMCVYSVIPSLRVNDGVCVFRCKATEESRSD